MFDDVRKHWAGEGRLSRAYWGYGGVGTVILLFFAIIGSFMILPSALEEDPSLLGSAVFRDYLIGVYVVLNVYQVFVGILVWRNAGNVENPIWSHVARLVVVLGAMGLVYQIVYGI